MTVIRLRCNLLVSENLIKKHETIVKLLYKYETVHWASAHRLTNDDFARVNLYHNFSLPVKIVFMFSVAAIPLRVCCCLLIWEIFQFCTKHIQCCHFMYGSSQTWWQIGIFLNNFCCFSTEIKIALAWCIILFVMNW